MSELFKKQRPPSVLGLAWDGTRLEGVVLRRTNGSLKAQQAFSVALALNPLTGNPELAGREIRNHLDQAGIRERRCVVALPTSSALMLLAEIPDLPEEDVASFLQIEAERGFPYSQDSLVSETLRFTASEKKRFATLMAYSSNEMMLLENALRAAQIKPVGFCPSLAALHPPAQDRPGQGTLSLVLGDNSVDLQVTCGGGVAAFRSLDGALVSEGVQKRPNPEALGREIRITLGQLPAEIREQIRTVRVIGRGDLAKQLASSVNETLAGRGLKVELQEQYPPMVFGRQLPPETEVSPALSVAALYLCGARIPFNFLPPRVNPWQQWTARFSSRKLMWVGAAAGVIALLIGGAFSIQQWRLSQLQNQWRSMEPRVADVEHVQQQIKQFRPWFDNTCMNLSILRSVTEAYPEEGSVSAKTVEVRDSSIVNCTGVARDNQAFLKVFEALRAARQVTNLKVDQVRGKTPMQYTINFQWVEGGAGDR